MTQDKIRIDSTSLSFFIDGVTYYVTLPTKSINSENVETLEGIVKLLHKMKVKSITTRRVR